MRYGLGMPRKASIDAPGALHYIIVRGIEQRKTFKDDTNRINFLDRLGNVGKSPVKGSRILEGHSRPTGQSLYCMARDEGCIVITVSE